MPVIHPRSRRIRILRDEVSRKIAAGEVIDRPFSIVRELLDNAIDAGAGSIDVYLEAGGLERVRVVDDGAGMEPDDLALCWQAHATSKIETEDDLLRVSSLGFRGEALSSIAVCSRLSVVSSTGGGAPAHRLEVKGDRQALLEPCQGRKGTIADVSELFYNYPARKKFLRSVSAEAGLCRAIFVDRAAAHPAIAFRLFTGSELKLSFPAGGHAERVALAYRTVLEPRLLAAATAEGDGCTAEVIAGLPDSRRRDRRLLQCFVNKRRVSEFALLQAVEYGFAGYLPGGWHPVAFVFVEIDPALVDFNIHPAKKEVRFRNLPEVRSAVVGAVRKILEPQPRPERASPALSAEQWVLPSGGQGAGRSPSPLSQRAMGTEAVRSPVPRDDGIRFLGQVFGVFLLFELPGRLLVLDQHAAHERIIFERLGARGAALQELLFPLSFDVSQDEERRLGEARDELESMGIALRRAGTRTFEVSALSADFQALAEDRLVELLRTVGGNAPGAPGGNAPGAPGGNAPGAPGGNAPGAQGGEEWQRSLRASAACRLAIKEGDDVDPVTARGLCAQALDLPVPRCPHGRPIWHELSEASLLRLVDRPLPRPRA